jgi:hypothetical protein
VPLDLDPLCRTRRRLACKCTGRRLFDRVHDVRPEHANTVAAPENGTNIVRIVHILQYHCKVWLTPVQRGPNARLPPLSSRPTLRFQGLHPGKKSPVGGAGLTHRGFVFRVRRAESGLLPCRPELMRIRQKLPGRSF